MLQVAEIKRRFTDIERSVGNATHALDADKLAPREIKDALQQLSQKTGQMKQALQTTDETRIRQSVEELEKVGGLAESACLRAPNVNATIKSAVTQAHTELANLKRQLH